MTALLPLIYWLMSNTDALATAIIVIKLMVKLLAEMFILFGLGTLLELALK